VRQRSRRILLLDDEEGFRRSLRAYLEDEDFEALDAESGEHALEIVGKSRIDVVVVDIRLPGMDGDTFIEYAHRLDSNIRFLVCTGSVNYRLPDGLLRIGMTDADVFSKPLDDMAALTEGLKAILKRKEDHERDSHAADYR